MSLEITLGVVFVTESCGTCGITWAMPKSFIEGRRGDHAWFHCPNGHKWHYTGESDLEKANRLKAEAERASQARINEEQHLRLVAERERDKAVRAKRKVERRIAHGVCPCCNKTFTNIANHMLSEHKDFRLPSGAKTKQIEARSHEA